MTADELRDEILRACVHFIRDNGATEDSMIHVHGALWRADERLSEMVKKGREKT